MQYFSKMIVVLTGICVISLSGIYAQDIHFSQYMNSPINLNPAETGNFNGDYRFTGNHKRQWKSFANAYSTFSASIDKKFFKPALISPSAGVIVNNDIAGDANFGSLNLQVPISISMNTNNLLFSMGMAPGLVQHGLEFNELYFGNQYDGDNYDPELPSD